MQLFARDAYAATLIKDIAHAKESVTLAAMVFDIESPMDTVVGALHEALERGVEVTLYIDVFTKIQTFDDVRFFRGLHINQRLRRALQQLEAAGVTIIWLGKIGANPYKRRFHQKIVLIDGKIVYFAGGVNLTGESFAVHDFMFRREDSHLADILQKQLRAISKEGAIADSTYALDGKNTLLLDGGQPFSSVIYDHVLQLAAEAQRITFVSQMAPSGKLARILRQKDVTYYLNSPFAIMSPAGAASELLTQKRHGFTNSYSGKRYIHAKCIIFTMPDGRKAALTGSHNFNERGVNYGTKELALLTEDEVTMHNIEVFVSQLH